MVANKSIKGQAKRGVGVQSINRQRPHNMDLFFVRSVNAPPQTHMARSSPGLVSNLPIPAPTLRVVLLIVRFEHPAEKNGLPISLSLYPYLTPYVRVRFVFSGHQG